MTFLLGRVCFELRDGFILAFNAENKLSDQLPTALSRADIVEQLVLETDRENIALVGANPRSLLTDHYVVVACIAA